MVDTLALSAIIRARLLPLGYSFGVVVCFEGGISSRLLLVDNVAIWVAEDLRMCVDIEEPYRYCNEQIYVSTRQELRIEWTYSKSAATNDYA